MLETIPATLGMPLPEPGYLGAVQQWCRDRGAVFVLDEIQTGLGRSGRFWCHAHDDVEPGSPTTEDLSECEWPMQHGVSLGEFGGLIGEARVLAFDDLLPLLKRFLAGAR